MQPALLQVDQLQVSFHQEQSLVPAVKGISFSLQQGEILGIVGESGSGKSVTSLAIMRLLPPNAKISGSVALNDINRPLQLLSLPEKTMQTIRGNRISMIFQEPMTSLNPVFTCGFQVDEAILLHQKCSRQEAREKTLQLFDDVRLPDPLRIYKSFPHELSGGQKQRVMIAMALSCEPKVLIADEPTTALDVTVQKSILQLLRDLQSSRGMSVIFITHDLGVVAELASRVLVMYQGEVVEQGLVSDLFSNPQHPYTKGLLACRPPLDRHPKRLPVVADFLQNPHADFRVPNAEWTPADRKERLQNLHLQQPILQVEHLQTWFPVRSSLFSKQKQFVKAVNDVSFQVFPGETLGLVGESGCGKTTLGRSILHLTPPTDGAVIFRGRDLSSLGKGEWKALRKDMQIIFQDPYSSLNPRMPVGDAILEPMLVHGLYNQPGERKDRVLSLLERVNLKPEHYHRYPHEFSGGQRQRIVIARALALHPSFLICDESVSALDVSVQAQVLNLLIELREEYQFTYIFISHDLSVVKFMSDTMAVMQSGRIEEMGPADQIYLNPQSAYTQQLIDAIPASNKIFI